MRKTSRISAISSKRSTPPCTISSQRATSVRTAASAADRVRLGDSALEVSGKDHAWSFSWSFCYSNILHSWCTAVCCLGTMTFGKQNTEAEAHEQLSYAADHGINFLVRYSYLHIITGYGIPMIPKDICSNVCVITWPDHQIIRLPPSGHRWNLPGAHWGHDSGPNGSLHWHLAQGAEERIHSSSIKGAMTFWCGIDDTRPLLVDRVFTLQCHACPPRGPGPW